MSKDRLIKLYVHSCNEDLAYRLDEKKVDYIVVGIKDFSCRFNNYFDLETLKRTKQNLKNSKLCVFLNDLYSEFKLDDLTQLLIELEKINIDLLMFSDFAIPQIIYEKNLNISLHYNPETLVTSYGQFEIYLENNIKKVNAATELTLSELKKMCLNKQSMFISTKGFGLGFIMHSRWPMVSNYLEYSKANKSKFNSIDYLLIQEEERQVPNIIYEDVYGTHMFTGYYLCCMKQINELKEAKLDAIIIDSLFVHDDDLTLDRIVDSFIEAIDNNLTQEELDKKYEFISSICELQISPGFFGNHSDVLHTLKKEG